eukprot:CAMPEP_0178756372 /NCGR_PEP_ID=MMETSP0744-20121128/13239_1 /TAXON_ID=913974 /ORGANISM="Nitzschia punctata, Strain CCMP561" /LENGTH=241 /DNA_ID=CAMNT_0020410509 /DNA_START=81 /DNA_END=806 /DNA_ORIENTATION=-
MPAIMNGRVDRTEWNAFCDQIEEHLQPLNRLVNAYKIGMIVVVLAFFAVFIGIIATFTSMGSDPGSSDPGASIFVIFLIPFVLMIGMFGFSFLRMKRINDVFQKIQHVCDEASKKHSLVSYHLRTETVVGMRHSGSSGRHVYRNYYIEVSISDQPVHYGNTSNNNSNNNAIYATSAVATPMATATAYPTTTDTSYTPYVSNESTSQSKGSAESRLQELEKLKHLLTPTEYDNKRAEILSDV